ncbi:MAG: hypothetical protein V1886_02565 [archaeon]
MISEDRYLEWKKRVFLLDLAEIKLERMSQEGQINENKKRKIKKRLNELWIRVWDYYPDKNPSVEKAFKLNFG